MQILKKGKICLKYCPTKDMSAEELAQSPVIVLALVHKCMTEINYKLRYANLL